jgi:hypothetical protein
MALCEEGIIGKGLLTVAMMLITCLILSAMGQPDLARLIGEGALAVAGAYMGTRGQGNGK